MGVPEVVCYFGLDSLYQKTTFWETTDGQTLTLLRNANFDILQLFEFISLALNFYLCLDIVLTMRNPFYPHDRRMKLYYPGVIIIAIIAYSLSLQRIQNFDDENPPLLSMHQRALFSVFFLTLYIVFATTSVAYAWRVNTRPGMSSNVRK